MKIKLSRYHYSRAWGFKLGGSICFLSERGEPIIGMDEDFANDVILYEPNKWILEILFSFMSNDFVFFASVTQPSFRRWFRSWF